MFVRRPSIPAALILAALALLARPADAAPDTDEPLTLPRARAMLIAEAKAILAGERPMPRRETDLPALRIRGDARRLAAMLGRPADRDPFVDAYVRWRLILQPDAALPDMNERTFARFAETLPAVTSNPMADPALLQRATRAANRDEPLTDEQVEEINRQADEMAATQEQAFARRIAAIGLRQAVIRRLERDSAHGRAIGLRIELAVAVVRAGWTAEPHKRDVEAACARAAAENLLTPADLELVASAAQRASGVRTAYLARARASDGGFQAQIGETAIDDFEVRDWLRPLRP